MSALELDTPVLHRPGTLAEVCALLAELDQPMVYGGGTAVQILLKQGVLFASDLVDIARVPGLDRIEETAEGLRVGAMVTLRRMETDPVVRRLAPLAAQVYARVANPRVRNTASVGGNLAHGDYRLDPPTALLALDARVELTSAGGTRLVPVREFFTGFQETALAEGELVTAVRIPAQPSPAAAFVKLSSLSVNDWPCASAAALLVPTGRRRERWELRMGLGALAAKPEYLSLEVPGGATVDEVLEAAQRAADQVIDPIPDVRGGVEFKRRLGLVAVRDAVRAAWDLAVQPTAGSTRGSVPGSAREEDSDVQRTSQRRWWRGR
ncbi:MAG: aerobic carbon-monoxide dehydrogenase medium subunit [Pseudonocardiales bacterium]|nr:aerobic carbon-monoxide dehydrogenase medium subunit [Pseudonocardiales bacterium]